MREWASAPRWRPRYFGVSTTPSRREALVSRYVGVDLHRRRCWVVVLDGDGQVVSSVSVDNREPGRLVEAVAIGGEGCGVVIEAAWGWYWIADLLSDAGFVVHLAHPLGVAGFRNRRVKNDERDAILLADLLRMGSLPEAWIAPPELRELRELVRYRRKLSQLRTGLKAQIHAGGRGKGGGVKLVRSADECREAADAILGMQLVTHQTGPAGQQVRCPLRRGPRRGMSGGGGGTGDAPRPNSGIYPGLPR